MIKALILEFKDLRRDALTAGIDDVDYSDFINGREEFRTSDLVIYIDENGDDKLLKCRFHLQPQKPIQIGDIIEPINMNGLLRSGASAYLDAVVVSLEPFVMVSRETDMMWSNMDIKNYKFKEKSNPTMLRDCLNRLI